MLENLLNRAVEMGAERIEIERKDGKELVCAFTGPVGMGIGWLDKSERDVVFEEMKALRKQKTHKIAGAPCRLKFSRYESFGEWVFVIEIGPDKKAKTPGRKKTAT